MNLALHIPSLDGRSHGHMHWRVGKEEKSMVDVPGCGKRATKLQRVYNKVDCCFY